jgi:hypothetical protein
MRARGIASGVISGEETYVDAVIVYRRALVGAIKPVDIISVGFLNNLQALLQSPADGISPLTGLQLVTAKVRHLWLMGGQYPTGTEYNFSNNAAAIAASGYVTANWPTPITYAGFEIGSSVLTGSNLNGLAASDLLAQALVDANYVGGRASWDAMNTLIGIIGDPARAGYATVTGSNAVDGSGANTFTPNISGRDRYVVKMQSDSSFQTQINNRLDKSLW